MTQELPHLDSDAHRSLLGEAKTKFRYAEYHACNPFRSPASRWERACRLVQDGREVGDDTDDALTGLAVRYMRARNACRTERQWEALIRRFRPVHIAQQIFEENGPARWLVEARLLSGQPLSQIVQRTGVPPEAIVAYEGLFFNVLERLRSLDWIVVRVLGQKFLHNQLTVQDTDLLLKFVAFFGGPVVLDAAVPYILEPSLAVVGIGPAEAGTAMRIQRLIGGLTAKVGEEITAEVEKDEQPLGEAQEAPTAEQLLKELLRMIAELPQTGGLDRLEADNQKQESNAGESWQLKSEEQ